MTDLIAIFKLNPLADHYKNDNESLQEAPVFPQTNFTHNLIVHLFLLLCTKEMLPTVTSCVDRG